MSAKSVYEALMSSNITRAKGKIYFDFHNIKIVIRDSSIVGNVIQEWLRHFMANNGIYFRLKENTQDFPDFLLHPKDNTRDLLEIKCFKNSPNFDVANFSAYVHSLRECPYRLDSDYLIFKYEDEEDGLVIKNLWLKKVWEICGPSERAGVRIQWKQERPFNIRPCTWYSSQTDYKPFDSRLEFVEALNELVRTSNVVENSKDWLRTVKEKYKEQTSSEL